MSMAYTDMAKKALKIANQTSKQMKHMYVGTEHILIGLVKEGEGVAASILESFSIDEAQITQLVEELIAPNSDIAVMDREGYTPKTLDVLRGAETIAEAYKSDGIGTEHILLSILQRRDCVAYKLLSTLGVNMQKMFVDTLTAMGIDKEAFSDLFRKGDTKEGQQSLISNFSRDLTELAREGKLDPTIGRVEEIHRAIQILSRRGKNNPCLIGEPGVGKTAIVEGLASLIESGNVPDTIKDKKILNLDLSSIVAGTKYRGEFEDRIKRIIREVTEMGNIILFVDEIHTIIGAGGAEGALDASNILKPSLARGEIQLIGATTIEEYRKYIEKDAALERRFQPIRVEEPTEKQAIEILNGIKHKYEEHHNVIITKEAVEAAVNLANRYINDRFLPD
ncbi:MAG: ATP-dependent Clp protease ATP-binding subunit, partial [Lachnospiraceae bacterium]|nr:ATP-dependent Clp protease ATP-binding subunit [Lachnospiraceae bacterium]